MMRTGDRGFYDRNMLSAMARSVREQMRRQGSMPVGHSWASVIAVDATVVGAGVIATVQRPTADLAVSLLALALAVAPFVQVYVFGVKFKAPVVWAGWTAATALLLFATSTPVANDFAPLLVVLMVGEVTSLTGIPGGCLSSFSAAALLLSASALHRLDNVPLYLGILGMGWLVGFLMRVQTVLMEQQQQAQSALAAHAAADERRRIAREVHDVIAHSLSVTLLHITGARRGLQQDRDVDDAVDALEQAEHLGRQAMADIRRTVGLLDSAPMGTTPEPGIDDISGLIDDFVRAGLTVHFTASGRTRHVSAAVGLALYRITQESLANIAKHSPEAKSTVLLAITRTSATLNVFNQLPAAVTAGCSEGRGVRGMRQRVGQLGGIISVGPTADGWAVRTNIPLGTDSSCPLAPS
jgi:signal transduction histidine kinase